MANKETNAIVTRYDVQGITANSQKKRSESILFMCMYAALLVLSVIAILLFGKRLWAFTVGIVIACTAVFLCLRQLKKINLSDFNSTKGEIADVFKETTTVRNITGGYGMYVTRKYDAFAKSAIRLTVSIKNTDEIHSYILEDVTEEHEKYYELKGDAIHIYGTHYPVMLNIGQGKWLCPVCGEFNASGEKICANCKEKVLK